MHATTGTLILVTGVDCHLCEYGREVLAGLGIEARELAADCEEASTMETQRHPVASHRDGLPS